MPRMPTVAVVPRVQALGGELGSTVLIAPSADRSPSADTGD